jgi:hypothetical protein
MSIKRIRESAANNGMVVAGGRRWRLVVYRQLADGSWLGTWFAETSQKLARVALHAAIGRGECAELWRGGSPVDEPANDNGVES